MQLQKYRAVLLIACAVAALLVASPALEKVVQPPKTDHLTELALFGQYHNATYPTSVSADQNNRLYVDVSNDEGAVSYYNLIVKFGSESSDRA